MNYIFWGYFSFHWSGARRKYWNKSQHYRESQSCNTV